ncbi:MAP kinase activator [Gaeumannomyces tritici R3-111a-1]|uniref:MAP kinase activator n=1 Tax=Gaeumannomyces tritici (strain R3-111a-1) TaxID=644352 RepID=J3NP62_GAET3|nr:MAP kinase activator [Gaeumannomyces tritici R3-111a-1]EJT77965.1 MAP kinase activator [Gaeumannomyces tritici R3-111a-1]
MRAFKALRRSIKGDKDKQPQLSVAPKSAVAIVPPKKVIRALYDYEARSSQELSFSRGDFFHVIGREDDQDWYEACNPALPDARGLVPVAFFQALGRTERDSTQSENSQGSPKNPDHDSGYAETSTTTATTPAQSQRNSKSGGKSGAMVYGIVMYDFQAERADELQAQAGEAIIVIAQSNPEWFVAKPIGRLGGPGLIPVSFIEIRDMASNTPVVDPENAVRRAGIPRVEEWKKMAADYKNSSITLGKFEVGGGPQSLEAGMDRMNLQSGDNRTSQSQMNGKPSPLPLPSPQPLQQQQSPYSPQKSMQMQQQQQQQQQQQPPALSPNASASKLYAPISASIPRYCFAEEKYWFVIEAVLEDGRQYELSRYYEDFYDFQIALLTEFPAEAGNTGDQKRTLPYMPGPVNYVTDAITEGRLHNLDAYVKNLLAQPTYISRCNLVRQFFNPREGDYEMDPSGQDEYRMSGGSQRSSMDSPMDGTSRQSSRNNLNGNGNGYGVQAAPRNQPGMLRQTSSISQPSQTSLSPGITQAGAMMKVKLSYNGDLIAIRVSSDIPYRELHDKIRERLRIQPSEEIQLSYKDEATGGKLSMISNKDLDLALSRNEKLLLFVELV